MDTSKPLAVFTVVDQPPPKKGLWCRVGTAFENRDGSLNVLLNAFPHNGRLNIREDDRRGNDADIDAA